MSTTVHRPNDVFNDPNFIVSGAKDHLKMARLAVMHNAKVSIKPIFPSMFTDLPHVPRQQVVLKTQIPIRPYIANPATRSRDKNVTIKTKAVDVGGADRYRFFDQPIHTSHAIIPALSLLTTRTHSKEVRTSEIVLSHKKIQTQYRDSSAQTSPWQPDYRIMDGGDPEILKLDFLKWGEGLPAGAHEVTLIERARMKRNWEKRLPPITDARSVEKRRDLIEAMEREQWAFREQEIQDIQDIRMELLEKMLVELLENTKTRSEKKIELFCKYKLAEKEDKLRKLKSQSTREKRRLNFNHKGIIMKYHPVNVVTEHADYKSELYAPLLRHGLHPKRTHQVIDEHLKKYRATFAGVEQYSTVPKWLAQGPNINYELTMPGTRICPRESKWTNPVLKQLHQELKALRKVTRNKCNLRVRIKDVQSPPMTPEVDESDPFETRELAIILLQSILKGRAVQVLVFDGRDNCRELIQELRSTHGVLDKEIIKVFKQKLEVKYDQREEAFCIANTCKIQEALNRLQGTIVGTLLDFLNKELRRLLDERKAHALGLMAERERCKREAAEAGRRQAELRRRREHDEIFKQVAKVHQESVDLYLEGIITDGMEFASACEASMYVTVLAQRLDKEIYEYDTVLQKDINEQEEFVAELVHHFVLPEVEKQIVRERIIKRQKGILKAIHEQLFSQIEKLPKPFVESKYHPVSSASAPSSNMPMAIMEQEGDQSNYSAIDSTNVINVLDFE